MLKVQYITVHDKDTQTYEEENIYETVEEEHYIARSNSVANDTQRGNVYLQIGQGTPWKLDKDVSSGTFYLQCEVQVGPTTGYYNHKHKREDLFDRLEFLVEAFEPLIAGSINVMEVIPYLFFIEDAGTLREKVRESPRSAVRLLIHNIKDCDEPGKWQSFLEALQATGYQYIANLLLEETESDQTINRNLLRLFTPELIQRIDPEEFVHHLLAADVISDMDKQEIQCEQRNRGNIAAAFMLLERIPRRLDRWFDIFVDILERCGLEDFMEYFRVPERFVDKASAGKTTNTTTKTSHHENNEAFYQRPKDIGALHLKGTNVSLQASPTSVDDELYDKTKRDSIYDSMNNDEIYSTDDTNSIIMYIGRTINASPDDTESLCGNDAILDLSDETSSVDERAYDGDNDVSKDVNETESDSINSSDEDTYSYATSSNTENTERSSDSSSTIIDDRPIHGHASGYTDRPDRIMDDSFDNSYSDFDSTISRDYDASSESSIDDDGTIYENASIVTGDIDESFVLLSDDDRTQHVSVYRYDGRMSYVSESRHYERRGYSKTLMSDTGQRDYRQKTRNSEYNRNMYATEFDVLY